MVAKTPDEFRQAFGLFMLPSTFTVFWPDSFLDFCFEHIICALDRRQTERERCLPIVVADSEITLRDNIHTNKHVDALVADVRITNFYV